MPRAYSRHSLGRGQLSSGAIIQRRRGTGLPPHRLKFICCCLQEGVVCICLHARHLDLEQNKTFQSSKNHWVLWASLSAYSWYQKHTKMKKVLQSPTWPPEFLHWARQQLPTQRAYDLHQDGNPQEPGIDRVWQSNSMGILPFLIRLLHGFWSWLTFPYFPILKLDQSSRLFWGSSNRWHGGMLELHHLLQRAVKLQREVVHMTYVWK